MAEIFPLEIEGRAPKMAKLSPIDFKIGFPIILKLNDGQNKFEVHISKNVAIISNPWAKIGQLPLWRDAFQWA